MMPPARMKSATLYPPGPMTSASTGWVGIRKEFDAASTPSSPTSPPAHPRTPHQGANTPEPPNRSPPVPSGLASPSLRSPPPARRYPHFTHSNSHHGSREIPPLGHPPAHRTGSTSPSRYFASYPDHRVIPPVPGSNRPPRYFAGNADDGLFFLSSKSAEPSTSPPSHKTRIEPDLSRSAVRTRRIRAPSCHCRAPRSARYCRVKEAVR